MHPDYCHNPPNFLPPPLPPCALGRRVDKKSFYLILFIHQKDENLKGTVKIQRRKTLDMLFDLISDIDSDYIKSMDEYNSNDETALINETVNTDVEFRVIYTEFIDVWIRKHIDLNGWKIEFVDMDIPNSNYPNQFHCHHFHAFPYPHHCYHKIPCPPPPPGVPPLPHHYKWKADCLGVNEFIQAEGDEP